MPIFRPGKPWGELFAASTRTPGTGLVTFPFDGAVGDGDWSSLGPTSLVAGVSGLYLITGFWNGGRAAGSAQLRLRLMAGALKVGEARSVSTGASIALSSSGMCQLLAGDAISMLVEGFDAGATIAAGNARLTAVRIGPVRWT